MATDPDLLKLKELCNYFYARKLRAKQRLNADSMIGWYFGIVGLDVDLPSGRYTILPEVATLEQVEEPPGEVELANSLKDQHLFAVIARYSNGIQYQLRVSDFGETDQASFNLAWWITSLIRVRTLAEFLVPVVADHSWGVISGLGSRTCSAHLLEDIPRGKKLVKSAPISVADLDWVGANLLKFARLLEIPSFRLAVESLSTHQHQSSERMMVATLWAGIEALFNLHSELGFRLASYIAVVIEPPGANRRAIYRQIKQLYAIRSKAVHGAKLSGPQIREHVLEVRTILSRILCRFISEDDVFSEERIEKEIFGG